MLFENASKTALKLHPLKEVTAQAERAPGLHSF